MEVNNLTLDRLKKNDPHVSLSANRMIRKQQYWLKVPRVKELRRAQKLRVCGLKDFILSNIDE